MLGAIQTQKSRRNILFIYCQELSLSININTANRMGRLGVLIAWKMMENCNWICGPDL